MTDGWNSADAPDQPGKSRTWWHPLLARLLDYALASAYSVMEELLVGKMPLRVDILLVRREQGELSEKAQRDLSVLLPLLGRFTLIEFKGLTDSLESGDVAQLAGCSLLWLSQQTEQILQRDVSLIILAPSSNEAFRRELGRLGCQAHEHEPGVARITGLPFAAWLVETDEMARQGQPILSLVSRVFLQEHRRIIPQLGQAGHHTLLLHYVLQQVRQFRNLGEDFAMQHRDTEFLGQVENELLSSLLDEIPAHEILEHLTSEERVQGLSPEERVQRLSPEERLRGLSPEDLYRLRELLDRNSGN